MTIFGVYKRYPFAIPLRVKFFNLFRLVFRFSVLEKILVARIEKGSGPYWKKLIPPLYFYSKGSFRDAVRNEIHFQLDISKQLDHSIYFSTVRDPGWRNLFQILRPGFKVIDVGANIGYLTLHFAHRCRQGMVYAFEPDSETFSRLSQNVRLNRLDHIRLFNTAIGARQGTGELYRMYESNPGANRILSQKPAHHISSEKVEIATLDEFQARGFFDRIDLIKIDVEGFELFVLQGARSVITESMPLLFIELVDQNLRLQGCSGDAVVGYLEDLGYLVLDAHTMKPLEPSDNYYTDIMCFPSYTRHDHA